MKWYENRAIAWIALAACVLVSVFGLGGLNLSAARQHALKVFHDGEDPSSSVRHSMDAYLDAAAESAQIMSAEAQRLQGETELNAAVWDEAGTVMDDAAGLEARSAAYSALKAHVDKLYNETYTEDKQAFSAFKLAYDDFWGDDDLMRRDAYPALARRYNERVQAFPGTLAAAVTGNGRLETFGG